MTRKNGLVTYVTKVVDAVGEALSMVPDPTSDQVIASCAVRADLVIATALLDVADAIRSNGTGASVERAIGGLEQALRSGAGRRET